MSTKNTRELTAWDKRKGVEAQLQHLGIPQVHANDRFYVVDTVKRRCSIAKSIRNITPILLAAPYSDLSGGSKKIEEL